jgi:biotin/methionine sulfoxide reductase
MASQATMLNIAWSLQRAEHGEQPYWMLVTLAAMLGQIGTPGGGFGVGYGAMNSLGHRHRLIRSVTLPQGDNPVSRFIPVARLSDMLLSPGADFVYQGRTYSIRISG